HRKVADWKPLYTDRKASFEKDLHIDAADIMPMITYGTNPGMGTGIRQHVPHLTEVSKSDQPNFEKALTYMGFAAGTSLIGQTIEMVFIGSCTNSRIEDLRLAAELVKGKKVHRDVRALVVPGSQKVAKQAEKEGLKTIFESAGFEFRQAGCSACLGMNEDKVPAGKYCVSTSNRNFEGRQGQGARTLLASPLTAAASAITGHLTDVSTWFVGVEVSAQATSI
ncbi:MAG: aconitase family protein, partial [Bacteroidota bacterium]